MYKNTIKEELQSVLHISSTHNKGGLPNINIVQISHFSNFFESKCWFILIYEHIELVNHILQI